MRPCLVRPVRSRRQMGALAEQVEPSRRVHLAYRDRLSIRCAPISSFSSSPPPTASGTSAGTRRSDRGGSPPPGGLAVRDAGPSLEATLSVRPGGAAGGRGPDPAATLTRTARDSP